MNNPLGWAYLGQYYGGTAPTVRAVITITPARTAVTTRRSTHRHVGAATATAVARSTTGAS